VFEKKEGAELDAPWVRGRGRVPSLCIENDPSIHFICCFPHIKTLNEISCSFYVQVFPGPAGRRGRKGRHKYNATRNARTWPRPPASQLTGAEGFGMESGSGTFHLETPQVSASVRGMNNYGGGTKKCAGVKRKLCKNHLVCSPWPQMFMCRQRVKPGSRGGGDQASFPPCQRKSNS